MAVDGNALNIDQTYYKSTTSYRNLANHIARLTFLASDWMDDVCDVNISDIINWPCKMWLLEI